MLVFVTQPIPTVSDFVKLLDSYPLRLNTTFTRKSLGNDTRQFFSTVGISREEGMGSFGSLAFSLLLPPLLQSLAGYCPHLEILPGHLSPKRMFCVLCFICFINQIHYITNVKSSNSFKQFWILHLFLEVM